VRFLRARELFSFVTKTLEFGLAKALRTPDDLPPEVEPDPLFDAEETVARKVTPIAQMEDAPPTPIARRSPQPMPVDYTSRVPAADSISPMVAGVADAMNQKFKAVKHDSEPPVTMRAQDGVIEIARNRKASTAIAPPSHASQVDDDDTPTKMPSPTPSTSPSTHPDDDSPPTLLLPILPSPNTPRAIGDYGALRFLGQVRATYLVCESEHGIVIIDQHAAAERLNFSRIKRSMASSQAGSQKLLAPVVVPLSAAMCELLDEVQPDLTRLGLDASVIGEGRVSVRAMPALLAKINPAVLLTEFLEEVSHTGDRPMSARIDKVLATFACYASVRAGDVLHPQECEALLAALDDADYAGYCPHGRPIVTSIAFTELERKVGRR
jgi:DNA mismatch repair ATPase MutL